MKGTHNAFCACSSIRSWLSAGPTSPGKRPYSFYSEITADLPHTQRLLHSPRHLPLAYSEVTPLSVQDVPPEWVLGGCTFPLLYHVLDLRTFHSTSCLGLLLTRDLFWSCPGLLDVVEQGRGDLGGRLGALVLREAYTT